MAWADDVISYSLNSMRNAPEVTFDKGGINAQSLQSVFDYMTNEAKNNPYASASGLGKFGTWLDNRLLGNLDWQRELQLKDIENKFNAEQAQIARDWEERMSNTAYQRAAKDAAAAGFNPGLIMGQGGASTPVVGAAHSGSSNWNGRSGADFGKLLMDVFGLVGSLVATGMKTSAMEAAQDIRGQYIIDAAKLRGNNALVISKNIAKSAMERAKLSSQTSIRNADVASKTSKFNAVRYTPEYFERANLSAERMAAHRYFKDVDANTMHKLYDLMKDPWGRVKVGQLYREWQKESK